jgi:hypothetical protein
MLMWSASKQALCCVCDTESRQGHLQTHAVRFVEVRKEANNTDSISDAFTHTTMHQYAPLIMHYKWANALVPPTPH